MWLLIGTTGVLWLIALVAGFACARAASKPYPPMS